MKTAAYIAILVGTILLLFSAKDVFDNVVNLKSATESLDRLKIETDSGIKQNEPIISWGQQDSIIAVVGFAFLIPGIALMRSERSAPDPNG